MLSNSASIASLRRVVCSALICAGTARPLLAQPLDRVAKLRLVTMARAGTGLADQGLEPVDFGIRMGH